MYTQCVYVYVCRCVCVCVFLIVYSHDMKYVCEDVHIYMYLTHKFDIISIVI